MTSTAHNINPMSESGSTFLLMRPGHLRKPYIMKATHNNGRVAWIKLSTTSGSCECILLKPAACHFGSAISCSLEQPRPGKAAERRFEFQERLGHTRTGSAPPPWASAVRSPPLEETCNASISSGSCATRRHTIGDDRNIASHAETRNLQMLGSGQLQACFSSKHCSVFLKRPRKHALYIPVSFMQHDMS